MTSFEKSVSSLMSELDLNSAAGLITHKALELMGPVRQHLETIKRLERSAPPPAQNAHKPENQIKP